MWVFTSQGFIAIIEHPDEPENLVVRANQTEHLKALFPQAHIYKVSATKYWWRCVVPRAEVAAVISTEIHKVCYPAFRLSIADADFYDVCSEVAMDTDLLKGPFSPSEWIERNAMMAEKLRKKKD